MVFSILLVEDNDGFRQTLIDTLIGHFAEISIGEANNAKDALIKAEALCPDLIFMDISLPGETGLEATRKLAMRYERSLVVVLTSYDLPEYRRQAFRNGADDFISKTDHGCLQRVIAEVEKAMTEKERLTSQESRSARPRGLLLPQTGGAAVSSSNGESGFSVRGFLPCALPALFPR